MRAVLDTNVVVSGLLWNGAPRQLLRAAHEKKTHIYTSTHLLLELADILSRAKFSAKIAAAELSIDQIIDRYALLATVVHPATMSPVILDDHVLACADGQGRRDCLR